MGEKRTKCAAVLLRIPGKTAVKLEVFPASEWAGEPEAAPGTYRIRQDLAWVCLGGAKYAFMGREAVAAYVAGLLFGADAPEETPPMIRKGSRVRLSVQLETHMMATTTRLTWTTSPVFQGLDGRWRVCVGDHEEPVFVGQVEDLS